MTLERGSTTIVMQHVPARVCPNCGEAYVSEDVAGRLEEIATKAALEGVKLDLRDYAA